MSQAAPHVEIVLSPCERVAIARAMDRRFAGRRLRVWLPALLTVLGFVVTRWWVLAAFQPMPGDVLHYQNSARMGIDCGQVPYRDFVMEYPPVAYWVMTVPRLLDRQSYPGQRASARAVKALTVHYARWYRLEMFLADIVSFGLLFWLGRRLVRKAPWVPPAVYAVLTITQPDLIHDRLDLGLLALVLLAAACWLRSLESTRVDRWAFGAYFLLGVGISFKLIPVVMVPFFLLADFWALGFGRRLICRVALLLAAAVGPFLYYVPSAGASVLSVFRYHSERGIHIESTWGSMMLAAARFGHPCKIKMAFGAYDVLSDWAGSMKLGSRVALPTVIGSLMLLTVLNRRRFNRRLALDTAIVAVVASAAVSHVYSPQYLNWLLPLALVSGLSLLPRRWGPWCVVGALAIAVLSITAWLFPSHYYGFLAGTDITAAWLSIGRSACLIALAAMLSGYLLVRIRSAPPVDRPPVGSELRFDPPRERSVQRRAGRDRVPAAIGMS